MLRSKLRCVIICSTTLLLVPLLFNSVLHAQSVKQKQKTQKVKVETGGINFTDSTWNEALKNAAKNKKYIFVDAYASWCAPCKLLRKTTFLDKETAAFFNENFINMSIDMEKGEGVNLATLWQVQAYPTMLIFDSSGKPVLGETGFLEPKELIKFGKQALEKKVDL